MYRSNQIRLDLNTIIFGLFCLYAFSMPYELFLERVFGIDTIFKPFRIISLLIIGVFGIKVLQNGIKYNAGERIDFWFYGVFAYGICISLFRIISGVFDMGHFFNDLFQMGLYLLTFYVFKNAQLSYTQSKKIFYFFIAGMLINSLFIFYTFQIVGNLGRQSGYTDNPNYTALGLMAVIVFMILRFNFREGFFKKILIATGILFFLYIFSSTGSRTGLLMIGFAIFPLFIFANFWKRASMIVGVCLFLAFIIPQDLSQATLIGNPLLLARRATADLDGGEGDVRFKIWEGVFRALEENGYAGMGIGQFKAQFSYFFQEENNNLILRIVNYGYHLSTHNDYLAVVTDFGLPGLFLFLVFLTFSVLKRYKEVIQIEYFQNVQVIHQVQFIMLVSLIIYGMTSENFLHQLWWFLLMFCTKSYIKKT